jgi:hypothetical protein
MKPPGKGGYLKMIVLSITSVISIMLISVNPLSAQSIYYRVHYPEFLAIVETLSDLPSEYIIAAPLSNVAMPRLQSNNSVVVLKPEDVVLSEDKDTLIISEDKEKNLSVTLGSLVDKHENNLKDYPFWIEYRDNDSYSYLTNIFDDGNPSYKKVSDINTDVLDAEFRVVYDQTPGKEGLLQLKTHLRVDNNPNNARLNIVYAEGPTTKTVRFRIIEDTRKELSIYRKDYFNIQPVDKETPVDNDKRINLKFGTNPNLKTSVPLYFHYILNDGSNVSIEDLMDSTNKIAYSANSAEKANQISVPFNGTSTTLWIMPVMEGYVGNDFLKSKDTPVGRIVKIEVADGGDTTGIEEIEAPSNNHTPQFFTVQGRPAKQPLAPGIYIKREGDKSTKILIK